MMRRTTSQAKAGQQKSMTDYWESHPRAYYFRQGLVISAELSFLVCACLYYTQERGAECLLPSG